MTLEIKAAVLHQIHAHGESAYPEEGAGFLLGEANGDRRGVVAILTIDNAREETARHNRYLITPHDMQRGEQEAARQGLDIIGIFHSHPDYPNHPSEFDREWALPWYSYIITSVARDNVAESRSWRLTDDRSKFKEETINISN